MRSVATTLFSLVWLITASLGTAALLAQDESTIRVERITPSLNEGRLTISAEFANLFSRKITGTIQSGLPSIIQTEIRFQNNDRKTLHNERLSRTISYDIWDERYTVKDGDTTAVFRDFELAQRFCRQLRHSFQPADFNLARNESYVAQIRVGIIPISSGQAEKVTDWLLDPNQTEEQIAADERDSGFRLNLNKLLSFFVSSEKSNFASDWFSSEKFRLSELKP